MDSLNKVQEYCLKWNNHHNTLVTVLDMLFQQESLVDVTLAAEGKYLRVHRVVLCACSTYFKELLSDQCDKQTIVFLKDVKFDQLQAIVDYMYRGEITVSHNQLQSFLNTAEALKIKGLAERDEYDAKNSSKCPLRKNKPAEINVPAAVPAAESPQIESVLSSTVISEASPETEPNCIETQSLTESVLEVLEPKAETMELEEAIMEGDETRWSEDETGNHDELSWTETPTVSKTSDITNFCEGTANCKISLQRFSCPTCPKSYKNRADMRKHMRFECGKDPRFTCPSCGSRFWRSYHLHRHQRQVHCTTV